MENWKKGIVMARTFNSWNDFGNHLLLSNPYINPTGCWYHLFNPSEAVVSKYDMPWVKHFVKVKPEKTFSQLNREERIEFFRTHGGPGLKPNKPNSGGGYENPIYYRTNAPTGLRI